ncbi:zinc transporter ZIP1-like [Schistocerca gregaria]|uniref:zinc transporter ZIP1-like n=1 Tax=Schistocerca gregaria TaxID=7010 RepID=UPI00211E92F2|nr:zinc transporter ZIP1-like [Schistocerca gregaria]XP_049837773.1 zinc transporter ZIP1-like [Schistocerca gregaria]XP_049837774.1 zinc transporter ZIP1-like [Schistocerca gregaria]XP_049837775.1 zinc transporter ZIP1-like [Schistocerca gregaria]XP_049837776.1 zinc transporter ZIP1-like [Schistocerca gregaria]
MEINEAKGLVLGTLFVLTFLFSMLPLLLIKKFRGTIDPSKRHRYAVVISHLSCFAAGVFMATALLHLFPEVNETLKRALNFLQIKTDFPVAEFAVSVGFFVILIIEQIVLDYKERTLTQDILTQPAEAEGEQWLSQRRNSIEGISDQVHSNEHDVPAEEPAAHSVFRSVLLLAALSVHSLLEGVAIGLQPDVMSVLQIFIAVVLHKVIIAFSLGLNLVQSRLKLHAIIRSNITFCVTSPLGIGIAMGLEEFSHNVNSSVINGVLQGLACGTFVYVTFFEVLPHEINRGGNRLTKVLVLLLGFSFICGILFLEPSDNTHSETSSLTVSGRQMWIM